MIWKLQTLDVDSRTVVKLNMRSRRAYLNINCVVPSHVSLPSDRFEFASCGGTNLLETVRRFRADFYRDSWFTVYSLIVWRLHGKCYIEHLTTPSAYANGIHSTNHCIYVYYL